MSPHDRPAVDIVPVCPWCGDDATDTPEYVVSGVPIECMACYALVQFDVEIRRTYRGAVVRKPEDQQL